MCALQLGGEVRGGEWKAGGIGVAHAFHGPEAACDSAAAQGDGGVAHRGLAVGVAILGGHLQSCREDIIGRKTESEKKKQILARAYKCNQQQWYELVPPEQVNL